MKPMKTFLVCGLALMLSPSLLSAADGGERLIGKWKAEIEIDEEKMVELLKSQGLADAMIDMILPQATAQFADATVTAEFKANGRVVFEFENLPGAEEAEESGWEVIEEDGDKLTVKGTDDDGEEEMINIVFDDDDTFTMTSEDMEDAPLKPPVFKRLD